MSAAAGVDVLLVLPATVSTVAWVLGEVAALSAVTAAITAAIIGAAVVAVARRRAARRDRAGGVWWELTPPARPAAGAAVAVWQLLGGMLRRHPGPWWWRTRLVVETVATCDGVRVGLWLPPALAAAAAPDRALSAVLPGARLVPAAGPAWPATGVSVLELVPRGGIWAPVLDTALPALLDHAGAAGRTRGDGGEREPLRLLYALLAARPAGEQAAAQLVVRTHHGTHTHVLGAGLSGGRGALHVGARGGLLLARGVAVLASGLGRELLDAATTPATTRTDRRATVRTGPHSGVGRGDPVAAAHRAARDAKRAHGPHLRVTLRLGLAGRRGGTAGRQRLRELVGGFDLVTTPLRVRSRRRHGGRLLSGYPSGAWFVATTTELAGLRHLPAEPARYGLPAAPARDRAPLRDLLEPPPRPAPAGRPLAGHWQVPTHSTRHFPGR